MTDRELIAGFLRGEATAIDRVRSWIRFAIAPYSQRLAEEREDLEQEIVLELTEDLRGGDFEARSSLQTYVRRMVYYRCIDRVRAQTRRTFLDVESLELPSSAESSLERLKREEELALAARVLQAMTPECRRLWQMLMAGHSYREMSRFTGLAEGALRARMFRCRQKAVELRDRLIRQTSRNKSDPSTTR